MNPGARILHLFLSENRNKDDLKTPPLPLSRSSLPAVSKLVGAVMPSPGDYSQRRARAGGQQPGRELGAGAGRSASRSGEQEFVPRLETRLFPPDVMRRMILNVLCPHSPGAC